MDRRLRGGRELIACEASGSWARKKALTLQIAKYANEKYLTAICAKLILSLCAGHSFVREILSEHLSEKGSTVNIIQTLGRYQGIFAKVARLGAQMIFYLELEQASLRRGQMYVTAGWDNESRKIT